MPRIVQCPKCRSLLREPPPGNPFYQCGNCSTTLQAKHATLEELGASKPRIFAGQQKRNSFSNSSSGEILSEGVTDDSVSIGNGNESPLFKRNDVERPSNGIQERDRLPEVELDDGSRLRDIQVVSVSQQIQRQGGAALSYPESSVDQRQTMKQIALDAELSSAEYPTESALRLIDNWPSPRPNASYGNSFDEDHRAEVRADVKEISAHQNTISSVEKLSGTGTELFTNGTLINGEMQLSQMSNLRYTDSGLSSGIVQDTGQNHHHIDLGGHIRNCDPNIANNVQHDPIGSGNSRRKLKWQTRDSDSADEPASPGAASSKGISEEEDRSSQDDVKFSVSVKETTSVEYVLEATWKSVDSRRYSVSEDGRMLGSAGQQQITRSPSEDSDRTIDMYGKRAFVTEYEPSETSSTTVEEVEFNEGSAPPGQLFTETGRHSYSPPLDLGLRSVPRPYLPRSNASSGRRAFSEESSSYSEVLSPDNHLDIGRMIGSARRHSWDDRLPRMGGVGAGSYAGSHHGAVSVRHHQSAYQDSGQAEHLSRMMSDPGGFRRLPTSQTSVYDSSRNSQASSASRPSQLPQQLTTRHVPPTRSPSLRQWPPNSASRPYFAESSSLDLLQPRVPYSARQIPRQLSPKPGHYPPLPPPGALPHVLCQHCGELLAVPSNLPPPKTNTQKLRCGSCKKISFFSVPQAVDSIAVPVPYSSRTVPRHGQSFLSSSADSHAGLPSGSYRPAADSLGATTENHRSGRRFFVPDVSGKEAEIPGSRTPSLVNEDFLSADEDLAESSFSERGALTVAIDSSSIPARSLSSVSAASITTPSSDGPQSVFSTSEYNRGHPGGFSPAPSTVPVHQSLGSRDPSFSKGVIARGNGLVEEKGSREFILSDSESDLTQQSLSGTGTGGLNHSNTRSPPPYPNSPPLQESKPSGRAIDNTATEQVLEAKGLKKTLRGISIFRKSKQASLFGRKVVVNGVPIPDHQVKKAEEQAGPIHPGTYWYDGQAGFWGVSGGQCLGIIPPFIEELSSPMTKDCSGGRTGILVNGRELHYMDRDKLFRRGLPDTPGMSYRIEIDGRVVEKATGSELRSLGRLAPSLEEEGRGTGMYVPSSTTVGTRS